MPRKRRQVRATTAYPYAWFIDRYIIPAIGDIPRRRRRFDHLCVHRILGECVDHYNQHRLHRTLQEPPCGRPEDHPIRNPSDGPIDITRRQVLGGLTNEYHAAA